MNLPKALDPSYKFYVSLFTAAFLLDLDSYVLLFTAAFFLSLDSYVHYSQLLSSSVSTPMSIIRSCFLPRSRLLCSVIRSRLLPRSRLLCSVMHSCWSRLLCSIIHSCLLPGYRLLCSIIHSCLLPRYRLLYSIIHSCLLPQYRLLCSIIHSCLLPRSRHAPCLLDLESMKYLNNSYTCHMGIIFFLNIISVQSHVPQLISQNNGLILIGH